MSSYPIHEAHGLEVWADVEYHIEPASGDGRNEPHEPAAVIVDGAQLYMLRRTILAPVRPVACRPGWDRTELGDAPQWVLDIIINDDSWAADIMFDEAA
jgi:hypothetical protein